MVDLFAAEIGMDPAEVRRKNFIAKDAFPHQTALGATYDSGDYEGALDLALRSVGYDELRAEQKRRRDEGGTKQLGIGISLVRRDHEPARRGASTARSRSPPTAARSCTPARSRTARGTRRPSR